MLPKPIGTIQTNDRKYLLQPEEGSNSVDDGGSEGKFRISNRTRRSQEGIPGILFQIEWLLPIIWLWEMIAAQYHSIWLMDQ